MPVWNKQFKLKDLLTEDEDRETVIRVASAVITRLKAEQPFGEYTDDIVSPFTDALDSGSCNDFNDAMEQLYDRADEDRVWIA